MQQKEQQEAVNLRRSIPQTNYIYIYIYMYYEHLGATVANSFYFK